MRHIEYNFSGTSLEVSSDLLYHELLVVINGIIIVPNNSWGCSGDYQIEGNRILFETLLQGVCVQLIPVTEAILA